MKIPPSFFTWIVYPLYLLWCKSLRYSESGRKRVDEMNENYESMVFCMWHGEIFPVIFAKKNIRVSAIVSRSKDGEYMTRVLSALGFKIARGSSSRGGHTALMQTVKIMQKEGYNACIAVDGPRGPIYQPKKGVFFISYHAKAAIIPMRGFMKKAKLFNSWDRFQLPLPFSKVHLAFGEPYYMDSNRELTDEFLEQACRELKERLEAMTSPEGF